MSKRDLLSAADLSRDEFDNVLDLAAKMKGKRPAQLLSGRTLGMLFFNRSLRTRVSFEVAAVQLGAHCINISADTEIYDLEPQDEAVMDGAAEEHVKDAARTLSRYVDALGIRRVQRTGDWQRDRQELLLRKYAEYASVPVINLESTLEHPCQAVADVLTMREHLLDLRGRKLTLAWSNSPEPKGMGPCHSILLAAAQAGMAVTIAHPLGFELDPEIVQAAENSAGSAGGSLRVVNDLEEGTRGSEVLYARSWGAIKYWSDAERETMVKRSFESWRIDDSIMAGTDNALFMHPLPLRRNVSVTDSVVDGERSVIYSQAENRAHAQKAILTHLLG